MELLETVRFGLREHSHDASDVEAARERPVRDVMRTGMSGLNGYSLGTCSLSRYVVRH